MNNGEEYVKKYNKNLTEIMSSAIDTFQNYYTTNNSFIKVEEKIAQSLIVELNYIFEKTDGGNELYQKIYDRFETFKEYYTNNKTISVVNNEIKTEIFDKIGNRVKIKDYSEFIDLLYRRDSIRYYFNFISDNREFLTKEYDLKRIDKVFVLQKNKNELHTFKELIIEKSKSKKTAILTPNQKMIILHVLKNYYKDTKDDDTDTEYFRILALCSNVFDENDFNSAKTNNTKYKYFLYGANNSEKKEPERKIEIIDSILSTLTPFKGLNRLKRALNFHKSSIKN